MVWQGNGVNNFINRLNNEILVSGSGGFSINNADGGFLAERNRNNGAGGEVLIERIGEEAIRKKRGFFESSGGNYLIVHQVYFSIYDIL